MFCLITRTQSSWKTVCHLSVRGLESHGFDHSRVINRNPVTVKPDKLRITIPVQVQNRALKRHRNPKNVAKEIDRQQMKNKPIIISAKNPQFNHRKTETY